MTTENAAQKVNIEKAAVEKAAVEEMAVGNGPVVPTEDEMRVLAVRRLRKQADFRTHLFIYVLVSGFLIAIWAWTGAGVFWPFFPIGGWGIGVAANAWDAFGRDPVTEQRIKREMERMRP